MVFDEVGFVVEGIQLTASAGTKNHQDVAGSSGEMGVTEGVGVGRVDLGPDGFGAQQVIVLL